MRLNQLIAELASLQKAEQNPAVWVEVDDSIEVEVTRVDYDGETNRVILGVEWTRNSEIATEFQPTTSFGKRNNETQPPQTLNEKPENSAPPVELNLNV